jgi:hypothetical protein
MLTDLAAQAGREMEILSGRSFRPLRRMTSIFETNGLPFGDIPDMQVGSMENMAGVREIADPVDPQIAAVLQGPTLANPAPNAAPAADALWVAGQLVPTPREFESRILRHAEVRRHAWITFARCATCHTMCLIFCLS